MFPAFRWTKEMQNVITEYNEGERMNPSNHNITVFGKPRSGKNQLLSTLKEVGMSTGNIKVIEAHASQPAHLREIMGFTLPNGYFEKREAREQLETLQSNLRKDPGSEDGYQDASVKSSEVDRVFPKLDDPERAIEELNKLREKASNDTVEKRVGKAYSEMRTLLKKKKKMSKNVVNNKNMPKTFRDAYRTKGMRNFNVKVLTPIVSEDTNDKGEFMSGMPSSEDVPYFLEPFAIPVEDYAKYQDLEYGLEMIFPHNFQSYSRMYSNVVDIGDTSFADLKWAKPNKSRDYVREVTFGDESIEILRKSKGEQSAEVFGNKWDQMIGTEGIVCGSDFEHKLRDKLKAYLLDDDVDMIVLYTGFVRNDSLRTFVMTYFVETLKSIIEGLDRKESKKLVRKFWLSFLEGQEVLPKIGRGDNVGEETKIFTRMMKELMNNSGHLNMDVVIDGKPADINPMLAKKSQHNFITQMDIEQFKKWFSFLPDKTKEQIEDALRNKNYRTLSKGRYYVSDLGYGFVYLSADSLQTGCPEWRGNYGCRLPAPRMCVERELNISNTDWSVFIEEMGLETQTFKPFQRALFNSWEDNASEYVEIKDDKREERLKAEEQEQATKRQQRVEYAKNMLRRLVREGVPAGEGVPDKADPDSPDSWKPYHVKIKDEMEDVFNKDDGFSEKIIQEYTDDLRDELKEEKDESEEKEIDRKRAVKDVIYNKKDYLIDFVRVRVGREDKKYLVQDYLEEEHEIRVSVKSELVESITRDARSKLIKARVINNQNNVKVSGESDNDLVMKIRDRLDDKGVFSDLKKKSEAKATA
jgi:hypothetical protein